MSYSISVTGTLFSTFHATQRCKVRPYAMDIHGVNPPGAFRLDARFLHNQTSHSHSVKGTLLSSFPAFQWYMLHLYAMDIHGVAQLCGLRLSLALSDSMTDSSTTRLPI